MPESPYETQQTHAWRDGPSMTTRPSGWQRAAAQPTSGGPIPARDRLKRDDLIYFTTQLAVMLETGVTLAEALDAIAEQNTEPNAKGVVTDLSEQVKGGMEFSAALERYPRSFGRLFIALMRASEASGTMSQMLQRACDYLSQERETVKRVKGAMIYPICMLSFCTLVVIGLLVFILPRFEKIYSGKGAILPGPTRLLLGLSHGITDYWYLVLLGLGGAITGAVFFLRSEAGGEFMDTVRIHMPVIGRMYRKAYLARSLRTMSTMVATGVSLLDGLEITAEVAGNRHFAEIWTAVAEQAKVGSSVSEELAHHKLVPGTVVHMVAAGEKTGQLAKVMDRVADFCEEELKVAVKAVTSLIEPLMIIIMGIIIGGIAMALLLPVFSMSKLLH
ncbi:MAG TPA: type II secretion system F family protein [Phycisphaerae bacterium]|nr:type II secretion system F family protein [Phycisphaerae bacterium]